MIFTLSAAFCLASIGETYEFSDSRKLVRSAEGELVAYWRAERMNQLTPDLDDDAKAAALAAADRRRAAAQAGCPLISHTVTVRVHFDRHAQDADGRTYIIARLAGTMDTQVDEQDMPPELARQIAAVTSQRPAIPTYYPPGLSPSSAAARRATARARRKREQAENEARARIRREFVDQAKALEHYLWIEMPPGYVPPVRPERRFEAAVLVDAVEFSLPTQSWEADPLTGLTPLPAPAEPYFPYLVIRGALVRSDDLGWQASGEIR